MKQLAVNIFKFYVFINFHVALSVVALYLIFNRETDINYTAFLFFSTVSGYNFIRLFNFKGNRFFIKKFLIKHKKLVLFSLFISSLLSIYYYFRLDTFSRLALIPFMLISFFYNYHFKFAPFMKLRNNGVVKIISVAVVWAGLTTLIPTLSNGHLSYESILKFLWVFFYVILLTLSFDQRDLYIDETELKTIPQLYRSKLLYIYLILSVILGLLSLCIFKEKELIISFFIITLSAFSGYRSNEYKSYYYTAFWIEALPVFWLLILYLFT